VDEFAERIAQLRDRRIAILERKFNPNELRLPDGTWTVGGALAKLFTGTHVSDLTPKGREAVLANNRKYKVNVKAMERELESKLNPSSIAAGKAWYPEAHTFNQNLAKRSGLSLEQVTAITAATSPRTAWPQNKRLAERVAMTHGKYTDPDPVDAGKRMGGSLSKNLGMAIGIARGGSTDSLTGAKRRSFFNNMLHPGGTDDVTVDTWMQRAAMAASGRKMTLDESVEYLNASRSSTVVGAGYVTIAEAVRAVAARNGLTPDELQAAYWISVTGSAEGNPGGRRGPR
jgi:hypothetical protein